jgi:hypothetical protein
MIVLETTPAIVAVPAAAADEEIAEPAGTSGDDLVGIEFWLHPMSDTATGNRATTIVLIRMTHLLGIDRCSH